MVGVYIGYRTGHAVGKRTPERKLREIANAVTDVKDKVSAKLQVASRVDTVFKYLSAAEEELADLLKGKKE